MLRQTQVFGKVRDQRTGKVSTTFQHGKPAELKSMDGGKTWFMDPVAMIAFSRRKADIAYLNEDQKRWLDLVELPGGTNLQHAMRMAGGR